MVPGDKTVAADIYPGDKDRRVGPGDGCFRAGVGDGVNARRISDISNVGSGYSISNGRSSGWDRCAAAIDVGSAA